MEPILVYVTTVNENEAARIGKALVEERLCACANILPKMKSIYWWKEKMETANESVLLLKTRKSLSYKVIERIKEIHSYECPCIVTLPIQAGNSAFFEWIYSETRE